MKFQTAKSEPIQFQLAPMIDVVFLLLCFWVVMSLYSQWESEVPITLPTAATAENPQRLQGEIIINVFADGGYVVNGRRLNSESLGDLLIRVSDLFPGQPVVVRGDEETALPPYYGRGGSVPPGRYFQHQFRDPGAAVGMRDASRKPLARIRRGLRVFAWRGCMVAGCCIMAGAGMVRAEPLPHTERARLANGLYARGLHALALEEYAELIAMDPPPEDLDTLAFRAGECARRLDRPREAVRYYLRVVALEREGDTLNRARYRLADLLSRREKHASALRHVDALLAADPDSALAAPAGYLKGRIHAAQGEKAKALAAFKAVLAAHPKDPIAAYAALEASRMESAPGDRARLLRKALELAPSPDMEVEAMWSQARLAREQGDLQRAAERYWSLWSSHPDSARVRGDLLRMAWTQLQAGEHARALSLMEAAPAEERAEEADTWLYLEGVARARLEQVEAAVNVLRRHREQFPSSRFRASGAYELAALHAKRGEHDRVVALRRDLQRLGTRETDAAWLVAESARAGENWDIALEAYQTVAGRDPKEEPRAVDASYLIAWVRDQAGKEDAAAAYRAFARRYPQDTRAPAALQRAGATALASGRQDAALDDWERALELAPDHPRASDLRFRMAMVDLQADRARSALRRLDGLLEREPEQASALYWSGVALERLERGAEAAARYTAALEADLDGADAIQARLRLGTWLRKQERAPEAVETLAPLVAEAPEHLPDSLLSWLFRMSETGGGTFPMVGIVEAMIAEERSDTLQELGWYARARELASAGKPEAAARARERGLAFESESVESVEAGLAQGEALRRLDRLPAAKEVLERASRLASELERGRLHARALTGLASVEESMGNPGAAARLYMGVAVLYEDPEATPDALRKAAEAFRRAGETERAGEALRELDAWTSKPDTP